MKKNYRVTLELDPRSGQWMADVDGLPVHTWGRALGKVKQHAVEALAVHLDIDVADLQGRVVFGTPHLPAPILQAIMDAEAARSEADSATARATQTRAAAARALVSEAHLSMRDAAELLGLSHQRVQQILAAG